MYPGRPAGTVYPRALHCPVRQAGRNKIIQPLLEFMVLRIAPAHSFISMKEVLQNLVYMVFFVGVGEELLFRGLIQNDLSRLFGWKWGLFGASVFVQHYAPDLALGARVAFRFHCGLYFRRALFEDQKFVSAHLGARRQQHHAGGRIPLPD